MSIHGGTHRQEENQQLPLEVHLLHLEDQQPLEVQHRLRLEDQQPLEVQRRLHLEDLQLEVQHLLEVLHLEGEIVEVFGTNGKITIGTEKKCYVKKHNMFFPPVGGQISSTSATLEEKCCCRCVICRSCCNLFLLCIAEACQ